MSSDLFRKKGRGALRRAVSEASDPQLRALQRDLADRQERVAQLQFEISDTNANLAKFENELALRLEPLETRVDELKAELDQARIRAARKAQWGDRAESPDLHVDVEEQFRKTWTRKEEPPAEPAKEELDENTKGELKTLFRQLAKRFHPDLVTDPVEKSRRAKIMAQINDAYAAQDLRKLRELGQTPDAAEPAPAKTKEQILGDLRKEIRRLDGVIRALEFTLQDLINSHTVQLMLEVAIAKQRGEDLVAEMEHNLRAQISELEINLSQYS